jgi:hypothetical protein
VLSAATMPVVAMALAGARGAGHPAEISEGLDHKRAKVNEEGAPANCMRGE